MDRDGVGPGSFRLAQILQIRTMGGLGVLENRRAHPLRDRVRLAVTTAESGGFEPPKAFTLTVFKTVTFGRSVNSPRPDHALERSEPGSIVPALERAFAQLS